MRNVVLVILAAALAVVLIEVFTGTPAQAGSQAYVLNDSTLVIEGRVITYIKIEGVRCVMAAHNYGNGSSTALSCDFLSAAP